jgi:hypothetical protein
MTEVFGPVGLPERFSSLLIRGAETAAVNRSVMEVSCGMAQAFKFPTEANNGPPRGPRFGASHRRAALLDRRFRPVRSKPDRSSAIWACPRLAASVQRLGQCGPRSRFPVRRSGPRLINPGRFDKNFHLARLEGVDQESDAGMTAAGYLRIPTDQFTRR